MTARREYTITEADDTERDLAALLRAFNAEDEDAIGAIISSANLHCLTEMLARAFLALAHERAHLIGMDSAQIPAYFDHLFSQMQTQLLAEQQD